jgi:hypothetical protein
MVQHNSSAVTRVAAYQFFKPADVCGINAMQMLFLFQLL